MGLRVSALRQCGASGSNPSMTALVAVLCISTAYSIAAAQTSSVSRSIAAQLMELNRTGRWAEAATRAEQYLDSAAMTDSIPACEVLYDLVYARTRLQEVAAGRKALAAFDHACGVLTAQTWLAKAANDLRGELDPSVWGRSLSISANDGWLTARPESLDLNTEALARHQDRCVASGADGCLVVYHGRIVQEWYGPRYHEPMMTMSSVKSWTSLLAGILLADGKLRIEDSVSLYVREWKAGSKAGVRIEHLLSMTSGLGRRRAASGSTRSIGFVATNKNSFVTSLPLDYAPGQRWDYSNEGAQLLSPILQRAAGMPLQLFARRRLFEPLHMNHTALHVDGSGVVWTYADAETTLRDFAKPCQLMLDEGAWHGVQVVPQSWVRRSTQPVLQNPTYGLLWWIVPGGFAAKGYLDTSCYVLPQLGLVVARMQSRPTPKASLPYETPALFDLFREIVRRQP